METVTSETIFYSAVIYQRGAYGAKPIAATTKTSESGILEWVSEGLRDLKEFYAGELFYNITKD